MRVKFTISDWAVPVLAAFAIFATVLISSLVG